ncbi:MAG TPA: hypothetical protein GX528_07370, partial [Firmicutes bacterium]|nr:hypothetical protein [Bacillota bacterium]
MKRFLFVVLAAAVLAALFIAGTRFTIEESNQRVELVYDLQALKIRSEEAGKSTGAMLADLKEAGIQSIGVEPDNLAAWFLAGKPLPGEIKEKLPQEAKFLKDYLHYPVAFDTEDFELVTDAGLLVVPKIATAPWPVAAPWLDYDPELLLISGTGELKGELHGSLARLGLVEFSVPKIEGGKAARSVRVHGISAAELETLSRRRVLNRYLRAVKERNNRVLYLRPLGYENWTESLATLAELQESLIKAGFALGEAEPFPAWQAPYVLTALVWAGIWAGAILFATAFFCRRRKIFFAAGIFALLITIILSFYRFQLAQQAMALLAAVIFPCLTLQVSGGKTPWQRYLLISGVSLAGAFLVVGSLGGSEYLVKLAEFRGVKVMHLAPVLLVFIWLVWPLKNWFNKNVPVKHLAIAAAIGLIGLLYLKRTGNFGLPVLQWEINFREFLEKTLLVRPRTKEFLLGHPALYFFVHRRDGKKSGAAPLAVINMCKSID